MASFKLKFRPSTTNKEGTLYFQVIHRRSTRTVYTDYHIRRDEWNEKTSSVRVTGTPERQAELRMVFSKVRWDCRQITSLITEKELAMVEYTADDIVSAFRLLPPCQTWFSFIHGMVAKSSVSAGWEPPRPTATHWRAFPDSETGRTWPLTPWMRRP